MVALTVDVSKDKDILRERLTVSTSKAEFGKAKRKKYPEIYISFIYQPLLDIKTGKKQKYLLFPST